MSVTAHVRPSAHGVGWLAVTMIAFALPAAAAPQNEASPYALLRDRAIDGDRTVDLSELRRLFTDTPEDDPNTPIVAYQMVWKALNSGDSAQAISTAESLLAKDFVDVNPHMVAALSYRQAGNPDRAQFHRFIADGLLASIKASGDGKTQGTAFHVITTSEEYALLIRAMGLQHVKVATGRQDDHFVDVFTVHNPRTNTDSTYYFNVDTVSRSK